MAQWTQTIQDSHVARLRACYEALYGPLLQNETVAQYANRCTFYLMRDAVLDYERQAARRAVVEPTPVQP